MVRDLTISPNSIGETRQGNQFSPSSSCCSDWKLLWREKSHHQHSMVLHRFIHHRSFSISSCPVCYICTGWHRWSWKSFCWTIMMPSADWAGRFCICPAAQLISGTSLLWCQQNLFHDRQCHPVHVAWFKRDTVKLRLAKPHLRKRLLKFLTVKLGKTTCRLL